MSIRQDLYSYRSNKKKILELQDRILYYETKAAKVTPTYSQDLCGSGSTEDRLTENIAKIMEIEKLIKITSERVKRAEVFLSELKPYQRHIITSCIVNHTPYDKFAKSEKMSVRNVYKIIDNVLGKQKPPE